jgi:hypothetical protein
LEVCSLLGELRNALLSLNAAQMTIIVRYSPSSHGVALIHAHRNPGGIYRIR